MYKTNNLPAKNLRKEYAEDHLFPFEAIYLYQLYWKIGLHVLVSDIKY